MLSTRAMIVVLALTFSPWAPTVMASAGSLDLTFAGTGVVIDSFAAYPSFHGENFVALMPDGRIVTAGTIYYVINGTSIESFNFGLTRHLPSGALDKSFGTGGLLVDTAIPQWTTLNALALQPDGRIVVVGTGRIGFKNVLLLIRYNEDGSRDSNFGLNGVVTTDLSPLQGEINAIAIQPDGRIVVAGRAIKIVVNGDSPTYFVLARYGQNGDLDQTFGTNGIVTTTFELKASANAVALQTDGKIVAAGSSQLSDIAPRSIAIARYDVTGTLDSTFGTNGTLIAHPVDPNIDIEANAVLIQSDNRIVTAGGPSVVRFMGNGILDSSFGQQGLAISGLGSALIIRSMVRQPDGRSIAAGWYNGSPPSFALARFSAAGTLDSTFGINGVALTPIGSSAAAYSVALQSDGKIVAAGTGNGQSGFAVARYLADTVGAISIPTLSHGNAIWLTLMIVVVAVVFGHTTTCDQKVKP